MVRAIFAALLALSASQAFAVQIPAPCASDPRVRCIVYDPNEVISITATFGYQTFILFAPGETLEDMGGGDTEAWDIGVIEAKNGIFIKPKSQKPATNITVVTNKRWYNFDFEVADLKAPEKRTYMVRFKYPQDEVQKKVEKSEKKTIESELKYASAKKPKNENYWAEGSKALEPTAAWDDGEVTYFRFAPNTPLPAVYVVNEDGSESLVNKNFPERNTMAIHAIGKKFVLRDGDIFTCIFNESYNRYGVENTTETLSPSVKRVVQRPPEKEDSSTEDTNQAPALPAALDGPSNATPPAKTPLPTVDISPAGQKKAARSLGTGAK